MHAETRLNSVPLVSWPLATPFCAKCANFECLNLGVQSIFGDLPLGSFILPAVACALDHVAGFPESTLVLERRSGVQAYYVNVEKAMAASMARD